MSDTSSLTSRPVTRATAAARGASNYAQTAFSAPARGRALDSDSASDQKLLTPERAGGRHRSPHGGDLGVDPFTTNDPWNPASLQLSPAILQAKQRLQAMRANLVEIPPFLVGVDNPQPSNADLMAKLDRMMGAMALKEDVHLAQMEVVKQMRSELHSQIEPLREKLESTSTTALLAREETRNLNERFTPVATSVSELLQNQARLFERVGNLESQSSVVNISQLEKMQIKMCNANDQAYQQIAITGFKTGSGEQRINAVKAFITAECGSELQCTVANEEKGPRNKRELTETTLVMFVDTSSRDQALKVIETKYPKGPDQNLGAKIEIMGTQLFAVRARTKIQKAKNWALRKAYELI